MTTALPRPAPPPPRSPNANKTDIDALPYYHADLTKMENVKNILSRYRLQEGHFLLRNSFSKPGYYTISVMHASGIKHFNVEMSAASFYLKDVHFATMDQLVQYYSHTDVPNKEQIKDVRLRFPVVSQLRQESARRGSRDADYLSVVSEEGFPSPDVYIHPELGIRSSPVSSPITLNRNKTMPMTMARAASAAAAAGNASSVKKSSTFCSGGRRFSQPSRFEMDDEGYTTISELEKPRAHLFMEAAAVGDGEEGICDCGLKEEKAALPRGWSVHRSRDPDTLGEIYFMSSSRETSWTLPLGVSLELTAEQQDFIRDLMFEFERDTRRTPRAKLASDASSSTPAPRPVLSHTLSSSSSSGYIGPSPPDPSKSLGSPTASSPSERQNTSPSDAGAVDPAAESNYTTMNGTKTRF